MLFLIGTGLCDASDLSIRAREIVSRASAVYLEGYTSLLRSTPAEFARDLGVRVTVLSREDVELRADELLAAAASTDVALLVVGDPFAATTHADIVLRARARGVEVRVVHNASVLTAIGELGLELYRFGKTVSIPYWEKGFEPTSFIDGIVENRARGLHTLCLLDIKAADGRFMSVAEGLDLLVRADASHRVRVRELQVVGIARLGWPDARIVVGSFDAVATAVFPGPPQCIVIPGKLHPVEDEMLAHWRV